MAKSEYQKMLDGELYAASDPQLYEMTCQARRLLAKYNAIPFENVQERQGLIKELFGSIGKNVDIRAPFYCDYGASIYAGDNLCMNCYGVILDCAKVTIGSNVMIGPNVQMYAAYHPINAAERIKGPELAGPITIGNNVWLAGSVIICQNVTIGDNTTIGAGSVVTRSIPANVFAAGNPCRVIRQL